MSRWLKTTLVVVGVFIVLVTGVVVLSLPSQSVETSADGTHRIQLAMLSVSIQEEDPLIEGPDQFLGVVHPQPVFDTKDLGPDLSLIQDTAHLTALDPDEVLRAVYLGHDVNGDPYYIWHSGSAEFRQLIGQIFADLGSVGRLETSYGSEETGPAIWERDRKADIAQHGVTTGSISYGTVSDGVTYTAEWHGLPTDVAAVVLYQEGEPVGWQRPVSGTAAFQIQYESEQDPNTFASEMVALTATGDEWDRYQMYSR